MKTLNNKIPQWKGKRVWIIGASSGIGAALVTQLRDSGAEIAVSARRMEQLKKLASGKDYILPLDVRDESSLEKSKSQLIEHWGSIDLVIYCAGVYKPIKTVDIEMEDIHHIFDINLFGAYRLVKVLTPHFTQKGSGAFCLVSSVAGYTGLPKALAYGPSKAAMINFAQILYSELNPLGIGVTLVNPGFVDTRLTKSNDFAMPALISTNEAANKIKLGLEKGLFEIHFPKRFTLFMKLISSLPHKWRFFLLKRTVT